MIFHLLFTQFRDVEKLKGNYSTPILKHNLLETRDMISSCRADVFTKMALEQTK